eukprot:CAMPEP_0174735190 /NCGR_PEP_ID=MMETSP1094-20130205/64542_1 /TAXON_ID=156173 /ORGANISM="Chrysochromulina brevifilum, Strain UTEX LB 985" /LENGTH=77 /DNA_ID=CAMNT_0015938121 /DNA_START=138 /DNA_END=372 /DNA_ORIENTATION=+
MMTILLLGAAAAPNDPVTPTCVAYCNAYNTSFLDPDVLCITVSHACHPAQASLQVQFHLGPRHDMHMQMQMCISTSV